jgi:hypothetical protein
MKTYKVNSSIVSASLSIIFTAMSCSCFSTTAMAQMPPPAQNVAPGVHPDIARAQYFIGQANQSILSAQNAHGYNLNGHAENARRLLDQASAELKAAALTANGG